MYKIPLNTTIKEISGPVVAGGVIDGKEVKVDFVFPYVEEHELMIKQMRRGRDGPIRGGRGFGTGIWSRGGSSSLMGRTTRNDANRVNSMRNGSPVFKAERDRRTHGRGA